MADLSGDSCVGGPLDLISIPGKTQSTKIQRSEYLEIDNNSNALTEVYHQVNTFYKYSL